MAAEFLKKNGFNLAAEVDKIHFGGSDQEPKESAEDPEDHQAVERIIGARLTHKPLLWDICIQSGKISDISPHNFNSSVRTKAPNVLEARGCLLTPSLCHAHIHLDKCFLLQDPKFSDLEIVHGDFSEAMSLTTAAKRRFTRSDLLRRGRQLIVESLQAGVTAMRAFVEVDGDVGLKCLEAGLELKGEFKGRCDVQICAFAQLPLFSGSDGGADVRRLIEVAAGREGVDVLGSTPYVEDEPAKETKNVMWIAKLALKKSKFLDLHLDYHLNAEKPALVWDVLDILKEVNWTAQGGKTVTLGHCTRLSHFTEYEWRELKTQIGTLAANVSFVGLPTSDLFMMRTKERYRGTLNIPEMIKLHSLQAAIAINNVGNAFTPHGSCDPLSIASLGVGLYSTGTKGDTELLFECVSTRAKSVIGFETERSGNLDIRVGDSADLVVFGKSFTRMRSRKNVSEVVYDPPGKRMTIKDGIIVSGW